MNGSQDLLNWLPLLSVVGLGLIGWGQLLLSDKNQSEVLKKLDVVKAGAEDVRRLETKVDGIDVWTRAHENSSGEYRLEAAERFAGIEKAIEIGMNNHQQLLSLMIRFEATIDKLEKRIEALSVDIRDQA